MTIPKPMMIALIVYLVLIHVLLGVFLLGHGRRFSPALRSEERELKHAFFQSQMRTFLGRVDEMARPGSVLFLGASGIQGMDVGQICGGALNLGIGGDTTAGVLDRLSNYTSLATARAVVLSVGYNDLKVSPDPEILANFQKILAAIPDHVPMIVCAMFKVDEAVVGRGTNERIGRLNPQIQGLCSQRERTNFLGLDESLIQEFGNDPEAYLERDGCHLNLAGRLFWRDEVQRFLAGIGAVAREGEEGTPKRD